MSTERENGSLFTKIEGKIAYVEFGHPMSNAFTLELLGRLTREIERLGNDEQVHAIQLKSEGQKAFCAGANFDQLLGIKDLASGTEFFSGFAHLINAIRKCQVPVIARIQGKTVGGGVGLISACDVAWAVESASIRLSEVSIGIAPLVIEPAVSRKVGRTAFNELAFRPKDWKSAYWAKDHGLFNRVFETQKDLDYFLDQYMSELEGYSREALSFCKRATWEDYGHWDQLLTDRAVQSAELALTETTKAILGAIRSK
jgi:methylglutaconyl-CoA hydratase